MSIFGGIASAVGSIAGGLLGNASAAASRDQAAELNKFNYQAQKEFAQNGIRWKVADAKAAGLHPLAALGSSTAQYSPSAVVGGSDDYSWLGDVGQGIGRAVDAKMTERERSKERQVADQRLRLEFDNRRLQNQFLQTQIDAQKQDMALQLARSAAMSARTQQAVPGMPDLSGDNTVIRGQRESYPTGGTQVEVSKVPTSVAGDPTTQAGTPADSRIYRTPAGRTVLPNQEIGDAMDAAPGSGLQWMIRNHLLPYIGNFTDAIHDPRRRPGEYFDILSGSYRRGRRIRDYFR